MVSKDGEVGQKGDGDACSRKAYLVQSFVSLECTGSLSYVVENTFGARRALLSEGRLENKYMYPIYLTHF